MNENDRRKESWIRETGTEALRRVSENAEVPERTPEKPLGGLVHIEGLGQVSIAAIRRELREREGATA